MFAQTGRSNAGPAAASRQRGDMSRNPLSSLPLREVMPPHVALALQQMLGIHTVGGFLNAWRDANARRLMEHIFDSPQEARAAASACTAWLGGAAVASTQLPCGWRRTLPDERGRAIGL